MQLRLLGSLLVRVSTFVGRTSIVDSSTKGLDDQFNKFGRKSLSA